MNYQYCLKRIMKVTLSFMVLGLLASTAYAADPVSSDSYQAIPVANHCVTIENGKTASTLLAANPELSTACRFVKTVSEDVMANMEIMANISLESMAKPDVTSGEDKVQRGRQVEAARYTGLARFYGAENGISLAENPELLKVGWSMTPESGAVGIQQQASAIQRFGLAEFLATERDAAQSEFIASDWPAHYGR